MRVKKTEPYLATYLHSLGRSKGLPINGTFELTARCNFDCPMCYVHMKQEDIDAKGKELSTQQWISIAREACDQGMIFVLLTGGEPFVRKDFFEIYHAMREMGLVVSINTNGSMLTGEVKKKLLENPPARINVSLYGGCEETYRNMCGRPAFETVINNIRDLKEAGVNVCMNLSITPYNRQDIEKIFRIATELGLNVRTSSYMYPSIRVNGEQYGCGNRLSPEAAGECAVEWDLLRLTEEEFLLRAQSMHNLVAVESRECPVEAESGVRCRAGSSAFWITWDGRMLPCGMMPYPSVDLLKTGFENAWEKIKNETKKIQTPQECITCPKRELCTVCAAVCVTETGRFDQLPRYVCKMTDATIERTWAAYLEKRGKNNGN